MPRRARLALPNVPLHLIQRGNNRQACFFADEDYRLYLDWLGEYADKTGCRVHAYAHDRPCASRSFLIPLCGFAAWREKAFSAHGFHQMQQAGRDVPLVAVVGGDADGFLVERQ